LRGLRALFTYQKCADRNKAPKKKKKKSPKHFLIFPAPRRGKGPRGKGGGKNGIMFFFDVKGGDLGGKFMAEEYLIWLKLSKHVNTEGGPTRRPRFSPPKGKKLIFCVFKGVLTRLHEVGKGV